MPRLIPVPLPWRKKDFQPVGETGVSLSYKGTQMCGESGRIRMQNIKDAVTTARRWLKKVTGIVKADPIHWPALVTGKFLKYFKTAPVKGSVELHTVRGVLVSTRQGLGNPLALAAICRWRGGGTDTQGYVRNHGGGQKGRIHISLPEYDGVSNSDKVEQAVIIVHEGTHKFASTTDQSYYGADDWNSLTSMKALRCADSYAYFVKACTKGELFTSMDEDDDYGLGMLFS